MARRVRCLAWDRSWLDYSGWEEGLHRQVTGFPSKRLGGRITWWRLGDTG